MTGIDEPLAVVQRSHDRLVAMVAPLDAQAVSGPSYHSWSIAQVLSHLGSGAEIFRLIIAAGLRGEPAPAREHYQPVWDRWNAKTPAEQAADGLVSDGEFLRTVNGLSPQERDRWSMSLFGGQQDLAGLLRMRMYEHAVHSWDIAVALDPAATLAQDAVELMIDGMDTIAVRSGKPVGADLTALIETSAPERRFLLQLDEEVHLLNRGTEPAEAPAVLRISAEGFIRLVYGRLDADHTPAVETSGVDLDLLRRAFPGL